MSDEYEPPYVWQEFPKMVYRGEEQLIVPDLEGEIASLDDGWGPLGGAVVASDAPRRGRPPGSKNKVADSSEPDE